MKDYLFTTRKALRKSFWEMCDEIGYNYRGKKTKFNLDLNMMFNDYKDSLYENGDISYRLYDRTCLY